MIFPEELCPYDNFSTYLREYDAVFEVVSLKIWKTNIKKNVTIIHHDFFHAILQCTLESTLLQSKTERHIVEGMLKNCPRLENLNFLYIIYITLR